MVSSRSGFLSFRLFISIALVTVLAGAAACKKQIRGEASMAEKTIEAVLKQHTNWLMSVPGVVGTAIGECEGRPCIKVLVLKRTQELMKKIPPALEGFPVAVEETGEIRRLDSRW